MFRVLRVFRCFSFLSLLYNGMNESRSIIKQKYDDYTKNSKITNKKIIYRLTDIVNRLNGVKYLIKGNHDKYINRV